MRGDIIRILISMFNIWIVYQVFVSESQIFVNSIRSQVMILPNTLYPRAERKFTRIKLKDEAAILIKLARVLNSRGQSSGTSENIFLVDMIVSLTITSLLKSIEKIANLRGVGKLSQISL